jgi:hypothetical protein
MSPAASHFVRSEYVVALLALVACGTTRAGHGDAAALAATQEAAPTPVALDARPAPGPFPAPPGIEFVPGEAPPAPATLERDGAIVGRLTEEGQRATLEFDAAKGELSLFELTCYGYARGWNSSSRLVVRDASGTVLANQRRSGQALYGDLLAFIAPEAGRFALDVVADEHYFRYLVVRHSAYDTLAPGAAYLVEGGGEEAAHGYTDGRDTGQRFLVRATPGTVVALRAEPAAERGVKHSRAERGRLAALVAGLVNPRRALAEADPRRPRDDTFPALALELKGSGELLSPGKTPFATVEPAPTDAAAPPAPDAHFAALARVPANGALVVDVRQAEDGPGTLFALHVERDVVLVPATVRVGDKEDEPVAGVDVVLLREPAFAPFARGTTGLDGTVDFQVPVGPYTVGFRAAGRGPEVVRTEVRAGELLNLVGG